MKKLLLSAAMLITSICAGAQNVQLHYDLGRALYKDITDRQTVTTTIEMFKLDKWGSTFLFTDMDYHRDGVKGAYWEIAREFNLSKNKQWAAHIEYNGGLGSNKDLTYTARYHHAFLAGGAWNWVSSDFKKNFSIQLMYKYYFKGQGLARPFSGFQLTEVWGLTFANNLCTFNGFCDLWYDKNVNGKLILISEPQFWFNLNTLKGMKDVNLSLGTEVEISNNFVYNNKGMNNKFYAIPTIAAKWTF